MKKANVGDSYLPQAKNANLYGRRRESHVLGREKNLSSAG
jgi:hypothetical protein